MAARIEKDGWAVSGDTLEELELGIAAVQRALGRDRAPDAPQMPEERPKKPLGRPRRRVSGQAPDARDIRMAGRFAAFLLHDGSGEVTADDLAAAMQLKSTKGLGGFATRVNRILSHYGFDPANVYANGRRADGARTWQAGPKAEEARELLRQKFEERKARRPANT